MPGLGSTGGKFQLSTGWRFSRATQSYFDSRLNHDFTRTWGPHETLSIMDVTGQYTVNKRIKVIGTMPIVMNNFSMLFPPLGISKGRRDGWNVAGVGDISLYGQSSLLNPSEHPYENVSLGVGVKIPSGYWDTRRNIPNESGTNFSKQALYVPAIYPGDGGVGILAGYNAYKILRTPNLLRGITLYSTGLYLSNPRDTNGTPSIIESLGVPLSAPYLGRTVNSVADTFALQAGFATPIPYTVTNRYLRPLRFRASLNWEGLMERDLIGRSRGFRQPGYAMSVAPGFTYQFKRNLLIVEVPIVFNRFINAGATTLPGVPVRRNGQLFPANFNPNRQMGLVAPAAISVRYVRTL